MTDERNKSDQRSEAARRWRPWYGTARWKALRAEQLRNHPWCCLCAEQGLRTRASVCDHVDRHNGDPVRFWSGPFSSLCKAHHDATKQREERRGRSGTAIGTDGWPVGMALGGGIGCGDLAGTAQPVGGTLTHSRVSERGFVDEREKANANAP